MPDPFDALFTVAEVAIALAGFSGVVAVLGQRSSGEWSAPDWLRFAMLLAFSFGAVLFSLLPTLVLALGASEPAAWGISSVLLVVFFVSGWGLVVRRVTALGEVAAEQFPQRIGLTVAALSLPVLVMLVLNALSVGFSREFGPFFLGVLWLLSLAGFQFYRLLRLQ